MVGGEVASGHHDHCAASACLTQENALAIAVQIIDKYFGRLYIQLVFPQEDTVALMMTKTAENFMDEYSGYAEGHAEA